MVKNTNRKMLLAVAMVLCIAMFVGSTFAWFTDGVSSGTNQIVAGNLDIELNHKVGGEFKPVGDSTLFQTNVNGEDMLWEPGMVCIETFQVVNAGSLALKYSLSMFVSNANYVVTADDEVTDKTLADVLTFAVVKGELDTDATRDDVIKAAGTFKSLAAFSQDGTLLPDGAEEGKDGTEIFTVVLYWEPNAETDNLYNLQNGAYASEGDALTIDLNVILRATQFTYEPDSFGNDYDANADYPRLATGPALKTALQKTLNDENEDINYAYRNVHHVIFADFDEVKTEIDKEWEDGIHAGATSSDEIKMFIVDDTKTLYICAKSDVTIMLNEDSSALFNNLQNLVSVDFGEGLVSAARVTNMTKMFANCVKLTSVNLADWDVSNVKDMGQMFSNCSALTELDLSGWDVSDSTSVFRMFVDCKVLEAVYAKNWNVSGKDTFLGCANLIPSYDPETAVSGSDIVSGSHAHTGEGGYFTAK